MTMKNKILMFLLGIGCVCAVVACGDSSSRVAGQLSEAESAIAANDVDAALHICRAVNDCRSDSLMTVSELGRLSILYMQLSDRTDDTDNVDFAVDCYRQAFAVNPDSARAFYASLPRDDDKYVMMLATIAGTLDNPPSLAEEEPDSLSLDF